MSNEKRPHINEVFTPRGGTVNRDMYIERRDIEKELRLALDGSLNIVVHGDSGAGKSWLYKKVLGDISAVYDTVNCTTVATDGTFDKEFHNIINGDGNHTKTGFTEKKTAEADAVFAKGGLEHSSDYVIAEPEIFAKCLMRLRKRAGEDRTAVLVIENLEEIISSQKLMQGLGRLIILLDDERYSRHRIKLLIVGVPADLQSYYQNIANQTTVANRLCEVPQVGRLTEEQVNQFSSKGLINKLKIDIQYSGMEFIQRHIYFVSAGIPQLMQQYCEILAHIAAEKDWALSIDYLRNADKRLLKKNLLSIYSTICSYGSDEQKHHQILFSMGRITKEIFDVNDLEKAIRFDFGGGSAKIPSRLSLAKNLAALADLNPPILKRLGKTKKFYFSDPRYLICIRLMFQNVSSRTVLRIERFDIDN